LKRKRYTAACKAIEEGVEEIENFFRDNEREDLLENSGELASLRQWLGEIKAKRPLSALEKLQRQLDEAIQVEDYEKAAKVRDQMKKLQASE
jgi:excinuclease UvrABC helicase subunit UvrB